MLGVFKQGTKKQLFSVAVVLVVIAILRKVTRDPDTESAIRSSGINRDVNQFLSSSSVLAESDRTNIDENTRPKTNPEVLTEYPEKFLDEFKNPCWRSPSAEKRLQCLPYFYLAGMPKSGTTDIWDKLTRHPGIWGCSKEPHWWAKIRVGSYYGKSRLGSDAASYYTRWGKMMTKAIKRKDLANAGKMIIGDGSASTFWDNRHWTSSYPNYTIAPSSSTPFLIHSIQPEAKIIVAFRDPVDRLFSDYQYFSKNATTTAEEFHEAVILGIDDFKRCLEKVGDLRTCAYNPDVSHNNTRALRLRVGLYSVYLEDWLEHFPLKQLLPVKTEDWSVHCPDILTRIHKFLNLDEQSISERIKTCQAERSNVGNFTKSISMLPETRRKLNHFYTPYNKRLATLLRDDNFIW